MLSVQAATCTSVAWDKESLTASCILRPFEAYLRDNRKEILETQKPFMEV